MSIVRRVAAAIVALAAVVWLTACGSAPATMPVETADRLSAVVLEVTTLSAAGDFAGAQAALDAVQAEIDAAIEAGDVSAAQAARIQTATDLVRADLVAAVAPPPPVDLPEDEDDGGSNSGPGNGDCPPGQDKKGDCDD